MSGQVRQVTTQDLSKKSKFAESPWKVCDKKEETFYGKYFLIKNKDNGNIVMVRKTIANTEKQAKAEIAKVLLRHEMNDSNSQQLLDWCCKKESTLCSSHYEVYTYWQNPTVPNRLTQTMSIGHDEKKSINHSELIVIVYSILDALAFKEDRKAFHGDIRPAFIVKDHNNANHY